MIFMYHKTKAPKGIVFKEDVAEDLSSDWVDTPAKFKESKNETSKTTKEEEKTKEKVKKDK